MAADPAEAAAICPRGPAPPRICEKSVAKGLAEMEPCCVAVVLVSAREVVSLALRWGVPPGCCELRSDTGGPAGERASEEDEDEEDEEDEEDCLLIRRQKNSMLSVLVAQGRMDI